MLDWKLFADLITVTRSLLGFGLVWVGFTAGESGLKTAVLLLLLCWTGDFVDGGIAHLTQPPRHTWVGDHDIYLDILVSLCLGSYLVSAGAINIFLAGVYLSVWLLIFWRAGANHALLMLVQAPIYAMFIWIALTRQPGAGVWLLIWLVLAMALNWPRFRQRVVPGFLEDMTGGKFRPDHRA